MKERLANDLYRELTKVTKESKREKDLKLKECDSVLSECQNFAHLSFFKARFKYIFPKKKIQNHFVTH